ncbi:replication protein [Pseudomonas fluorescens HK44]|uniref:Replication protein n=2 Tax=Pseudomonas fluorescens TaxID=294 RepID=A0A010S5C7_PSEFL|nr:replication protein [Pseudomonas fluorescens HK44]
MENSLMDALMVIDLPGRELKVALFIAKATINFQAGPVRIKAAEVSKSTNLHPDVVSKAISHLLKRRVIFREGGSRGDIGLCDPKEWAYVECPSRTKRSDSGHMGRVVSITRQTKTDDSLLYSKKETLLPLSTKESNAPLEKSKRAPRKTKPAADSAFGKAQMLADNPHQIPDQLLVDWLALRKTKRAAVSLTVWDALNAELTKCAELGILAKDAMTEALSAGWQGFKADWIANRLAQAGRAPSAASAGPDFYSTAWRNDLSDEL